MDQEVRDMLRKGAMVVSDLKENKFLSSLFFVKKRDGGGEVVGSPSSQPKGPEQKYQELTAISKEIW